jgi:serine/threonine-protein kinase
MLEERRCAECGATYDPNTRYCKRDGKPLVVTKTLIGRVLHAKYRIDDWLGGGGMANVYRATHQKMGEEVAVKVLNPDQVGIERMTDRFRNEARAAMRINHPNAIKVYDFDITEDNLHYLVMEIVKGRVLRDFIEEESFDYRRAVKIISQICGAIDAAHHQKIIHRDLKPDNIIVQNQDAVESVKVLDFGIARLREIENSNSSKAVYTAPGVLIGTPPYMSPEQCRGREVGPASDVYSIGVIAYEMLAQRTPFVFSGDFRDIFNQVKNDPPPPIRLFAKETPASIERVILRALEKNPDDRPSSPNALAQELRKAVKEADGAGADPIANKTTILGKIKGITGHLTHSPHTPPDDVIDTPLIEPPVQAVDPPSKLRPILIAAAGVLATVILYFAYRAVIQEKPIPKANPPLISDKFGEMVLIPGGKFTMGRNNGEEDERPAYEVEVKGFYLDKYEVTNQQYQNFVVAKKHSPPSHWNGGSYPPGEAQLPVTHVTLTDAQAYAGWAGKRLPLESEWEYAARGGNKGYLYPWGNHWIAGYANGAGIKGGPQAVGAFEKDQSFFGVFDLAGNVGEWVDALHLKYVDNIPITKCGAETCQVYRGGSFADPESKCTTTRRWADFADIPSDPESQKGYLEIVFPTVGFRCAKDAPR